MGLILIVNTVQDMKWTVRMNVEAKEKYSQNVSLKVPDVLSILPKKLKVTVILHASLTG